MAVYVIGDLHLSFKNPKPMDIFGDNWENHEEKIRKNWIEAVKKDDTIILAGDFSWAMNLEDAKLDFGYINELPGKKILLKGNHDYWWTTLTKMKQYLQQNKYENIEFLFNNSYKIKNIIITGSRGWAINEKQVNEKIINRELGRLELSFIDAQNKCNNNEEIVVIMHYPPITNSDTLNKSEQKFIQLMKKYDIKRCYYGHLHGKSHIEAIKENVNGIKFKLISGDYIDFKPIKIEE